MLQRTTTMVMADTRKHRQVSSLRQRVDISIANNTPPTGALKACAHKPHWISPLQQRSAACMLDVCAGIARSARRFKALQHSLCTHHTLPRMLQGP